VQGGASATVEPCSHNPNAAAALQTAINTAKGVQGNADATQLEVETAKRIRQAM